MLERIYYSHGKNNFKNNTFSAEEWSAPLMVSPVEIKGLLCAFNLEGRKIEQIKTIGLAYNMSRFWIEERAYDYLKELNAPDYREKSDYSKIDASIPYYRFAEIDEPLLIKFEDGNTFEINTPQVPEFSMSMNCIPWDIEAGTNPPNVDANILFAPCIGRTIGAVEVETSANSSSCPAFDEDSPDSERVSAITLRLDNGAGLRIEGFIDSCHVIFLNERGEKGTLSFEELQTALFNWEDLHTDSLSGYEADSCTFYFGEPGAKHAEEPFMTLVPGKKKTNLNIAVSDFTLFDWSMTHYLRKPFDEYGEYEFTKAQWNEILAEAEKLVSFESFDALFEYATGIKIYERRIIGGGKYSVTLNNMNCRGAEFWKQINSYRTQLKDMKAWTELVLSDSDKMILYGF